MIEVVRSDQVVIPDSSRVVARPFIPGSHNFGGTASRLDLIAGRVIAMTAEERAVALESSRITAAGRHRDIEAIWLRHFRIASDQSELVAGDEDEELRLLLGAYFTQEYAAEGAALTNPSIVPFGDVDATGAQRFVMSARAIGEGHISSIAFLTGTVSAAGAVTLDPRTPFVTNGTRADARYERRWFRVKLSEFGVDNEIAERVLGELGDVFEAGELDAALSHVVDSDIDPVLAKETLKRIHWVAASNYRLEFPDGPISERLISPAGPAESRGMEDARFVRFEEGGSTRFFATYTAFDGVEILPQLIETPDFASFRISTLSGPMAYHKGLALFPRKIDDDYVALSRHDQESTFVLRSDHPRVWRNAELVFRPEQPWEAVQGGNSGSPLETEAGWLVITHGVGPMRRYVLGAVLLDLEDPARLIGRLPQPLLEPSKEERDGYVPNVVYSCGSMVHAGNLILPYGFADYGIGVAVARVDDILDAMV